MSGNQSHNQRLAQLIALVDQEAHHLLAVRQRFIGNDCAIDKTRLSNLLENDTGIDRLESFGAKFARMQDTIVDKLIPTVLNASGERAMAAIDNLAKMERLALIESADDWLEMRGLRNRLVHEYIDRPDDLALALERACHFTDSMQRDYQSIREYAVNQLQVPI